MYCIKLQLLINASLEHIFEKLTSINGLQEWWTLQTTGDANKDGIIDFRFGEKHFIQMKVTETKPNEFVKWKCLQADEDWIGTIVTFSLEKNNEKTLLRFKHDNWPTHGDFFAHCSLSWAKYLLSLRDLMELGEGRPFKP